MLLIAFACSRISLQSCFFFLFIFESIHFFSISKHKPYKWTGKEGRGGLHTKQMVNADQ